ncbi:MAG: hypothetical protein N2Z62_16305 [Rhodobacteraceae bacterium]|nr:hypothetical protein [Paracoccaceae bacterium]
MHGNGMIAADPTDPGHPADLPGQPSALAADPVPRHDAPAPARDGTQARTTLAAPVCSVRVARAGKLILTT